MDELDRILKNKFAPLKDMDLPNEDQEWEKMQKKVKWQNFNTFRLGSMNVYYAAFSLVLVALCGMYGYSKFGSDKEKGLKNEIKFIEDKTKLEDSNIEVIAKTAQKAVQHTKVKSENKKGKFETIKVGSKISLSVSENPEKDSVQMLEIPEKEIVQKVVPKSKFVFKTDTVVQTDTLKVKNIKRYQKNNQTQP